MTASNILETTDWSHLLHACGTAEGAVPALKTLQGEDPDAMTQAVDVLEPCFLRQSASPSPSRGRRGGVDLHSSHGDH